MHSPKVEASPRAGSDRHRLRLRWATGASFVVDGGLMLVNPSAPPG